MVLEDFEVGELVWAKMKGFPVWPGKIAEPSSDAKPPKNKKAHFVYFFGTKNFAWIMDENINRHCESFLNSLGKKKSPALQSAITDMINFSKEHIKDKHSPKKEKAKSYFKKASPTKIINDTSKKVDKKVLESETIKKEAKKRVSDSSFNGEYDECSAPKIPKLTYDSLFRNVDSSTPAIDKSDNHNESLLGTFDSFLTSVKQGKPISLLRAKNISPPVMQKIGFIGLGFVGRAVVTTLLKLGYDITVWNRTPFKLETMVQLGAKKARSPADLIANCDITFCSVSDPDASKSLIFGERGILKGFEEAEKLGFRNRGYVEMTTIDPETSQEIAEAIGRKNGKYLEAPICGSSIDAVTGQLIIVAAGDRNLFSECETYFQVIAKHAYYLGMEIGVGTKFGLLLNSFSGILYAVIAECLSLAKRLDLDGGNFIDILQGGPLQKEWILQKCQKMIKLDFGTATPLKYMQKELNLTLLMGNQCNQHMPITAAANEVYKHARQLQYSDLDVSAVYQGVRQ